MCTRILWSSGGAPGRGTVAVARTLDWMEDTNTVLAARPRGAHRHSGADQGEVTWTSRYASVVSLLYRRLSADGLNETGFNANGLYLSEADYGVRDPIRPGFMLGTIVQYLLDSFSTVAQAVAWFEQTNPQLVAESIGSEPGTAHLSVADRTGDSAVIEFLNGQTHIHHGPETTVMTNSPAYDEQLSEATNYLGLGGDKEIPGGPDSPERFVRAATATLGLPNTDSSGEAIAMLLSAIRTSAVPYGVDVPGKPNVAATRWVVVSDLTDCYYYFGLSLSPSVIWVDLNKLVFPPGATELWFDPSADLMVAGDITDRFTAIG